jgi:ornithine carbamoyltransferase
MSTTGPRHFLDLDRFDRATLRAILERAKTIKADIDGHRTLAKNKVLACIFEKPSTRTRVSFEVGMRQLGGDVLVLKPDEMQIGRGESIPDTARVLSRFVDIIMVRTLGEERIHELAAYADVPVINALTDQSHPCQIMADVLTIEERVGPVEGKTVAWVGDANNVAASFAHAAARFGFHFRVACPEGFEPSSELVAWVNREGGSMTVMRDPREAVAGADCVVTDAWVSMGNTDVARRRSALEPYQVNEALMALAKPTAIFEHCLPAHRGEEVTDAVMDGPQSAVWDEAENRLHAQKAILAWCLGV